MDNLGSLPFHIHFGVNKQLPNFADLFKETTCDFFDFSLIFLFFISLISASFLLLAVDLLSFLYFFLFSDIGI